MIASLKRLLPAPLRKAISRRLGEYIVSRGYVPFDARLHYAEDGLFTIHDQTFRDDPRFREAYARGLQASDGVDPNFEWRVHVALWAAATALRAPGDFVECGVNAGFISSAIMRRLGWAGVPRNYYLVDTFAGPVVEQFSPAELRQGKGERVRDLLAAGAYVTDVKRARDNFAEWPNAVLVPGAIPDILPAVPADRVAFLHIDLNCAAPERAALDYFWEKLSRGAIVLLDDYAYHNYGEQKRAMDDTARKRGVGVLALPTGQGLIVA